MQIRLTAALSTKLPHSPSACDATRHRGVADARYASARYRAPATSRSLLRSLRSPDRFSLCSLARFVLLVLYALAQSLASLARLSLLQC
jgi:hypothetical protein